MITKTQLGQVPPTVMGSLSDRNSGWYPIYAAVRTEVDGRHYGAFAKVLVRYADDFCGGVQVRSCTAGSCTPRKSSWGYEGQWFGRYLSDDSPRGDSPTDQFPDTVGIPFVAEEHLKDRHGHIDTGVMKDLCFAALASRVMLFANESKRNGIFGTDRVEDLDEWDSGNSHGIRSLMAYMTRMSGWTDWKAPYFAGGLNSGTRSNAYYPQPYQRSVGVSEFYNFNSERDVAVFTSYHTDIPEEEGYCEDWWDRNVSRSTNYKRVLNAADKAEHKALYNLCPTTEWCVG